MADPVTIWTLDWVPETPRGFVRDLRLRWACEEAGEVIDPHTAIGLHAARAVELPVGVPVVTLATAHPAKFPDAVERATGTRPSLPPRVGDLFAREEAYTELAGTYEAVRDHIVGHAA